MPAQQSGSNNHKIASAWLHTYLRYIFMEAGSSRPSATMHCTRTM